MQLYRRFLINKIRRADARLLFSGEIHPAIMYKPIARRIDGWAKARAVVTAASVQTQWWKGECAGRPDRRKKYPFRNWSRMLSAIYRLAKSAVSLSRLIDLNRFHDVLIATSFNTPFGLGSRQPTVKPNDQSGDPYISPFVAVALVFRQTPCSNHECVSH